MAQRTEVTALEGISSDLQRDSLLKRRSPDRHLSGAPLRLQTPGLDASLPERSMGGGMQPRAPWLCGGTLL